MKTVSVLEWQEPSNSQSCADLRSKQESSFLCVCAAEISLKGTSRTLEPISDKKMYIPFSFFIRCIALLLESSLKRSVFQDRITKWKVAASSKKAIFAEKLKQQPLIEFWEKEVLRDCLLWAARWAGCYQATWLSKTNASAQWVSQKALYMIHCIATGCLPF